MGKRFRRSGKAQGKVMNVITEEVTTGSDLLEAVDEASEVISQEPGQPLEDAVLSSADMRRYYEGLERLDEAQRAVDDTGSELLT
jgi:hypothetical protein